MADDNDGAESVLAGGWLSPRTLLHKTTKFVLNAAHGKTRSLIPTSDIGTVAETGVVDWIEDVEDDDIAAGMGEEVEQTIMVPERDVLMGRWSECAAASGEGRSPTPPGMMRLSRSVPPRRRTAYNKDPQQRVGAKEPKRRAQRGRTVFTMLPVRVVGRIMEFLPVDTMLLVANICRIVRRAVYLHGPNAQGMAGDQAYTSVGLHMWRVRVQQMGWRMWRERQRGRERRLRVQAPQSHVVLLEHICGVKDEAGILELLTTEPDLVFKALYDNMIGDYTAFSKLNGCVPRVVQNANGAAAVAERLDQLLWFARGRFTCSSDVTNMRLVSAADRFEAEYQAQFKHAFMQGDCERMQGCARVLEHIRNGRSCIRILVDAHPLFSSAPPAPYADVLASTECVTDAHTFGAVLSELDNLIAEHARVVHAGLPSQVLRQSALYCFVQDLFDAKRSGVALRALQNMYAHLRSMPVAGQDASGEQQRRDVVPDEATKDIVYLSTVASIVSLLLEAADKWSCMEPVSLPRGLGRRCVFSAFEDVIDEYVQLERRVIERAYEGELSQWALKVRNDSMRDTALESNASHKDESLRLVNFRLRQQQMEEYKDRVLLLVQDKLQISMDTETAGDGTRRRRRSSASQKEMPRRTVVGDVLGHAPVSIDLCLNMVLTNRDTIDRLAVFASAPQDMRLRDQAQDAIESVFCVLLRGIGNHVRPAYARVVAELKDLEHSVMATMQTDQSALAQLEQQTRSSFIRAELRFFELIHLCDLCVQILEIYFKSFMTAFIDEHDFLNTCNQERKALERAVDDSVAVGMDCVIEIIMRQTQHIVDTQMSADYSPDSNVSLTLTPTVACTRAVQFLGESTVILQSMTGHRQMRTVFLGEIGVRLFYVLLEHIKRFRITEPGGFQLIADLNLYYDWAAEHVDPETLRYFTALKDLANCFILAPRDLRGFLQDQYSRRTFDGVMRSEEVYDVVACRSDYRNIRTQVEGHCDFM
ncbi:F-box protein: endocytic membrane traffic, recycling ReCYcling 1 [Coemansia sp. RSA 551]|nr:F-box protein: endocytic membrane traffic, recycling ReCYcling 1 [Coemansia sp. RSA 551]